MEGKFCTTANGFKSYEIFDADENSIFNFADILEQEFQFTKFKVPVVGLDGIYWDFYKDEEMITLGWDNWSGIFIMSNSELGDLLVTQIGNYINSILTDLRIS